MLKLFYWLLVAVLSLIIIVFAVNNREPVELDLWLYQTPPLPLFIVALLGIFVGFLFGGLVAWVGAGRSRTKARNLQRRHEADEREKAILRRKIEKMEAAEKQATIPLPPADAA